MSRFKETSDRGFGDTIARFTKATGIEKAVKKVAKAVGVEDCGCSKRQEALNKLIPYNKDANATS